MHPTPVLHERGQLIALIQPLGLGRRVSFHLEGAEFSGAPVRYPEQGEVSYTVSKIGPLPLGGLARLVGRGS